MYRDRDNSHLVMRTFLQKTWHPELQLNVARTGKVCPDIEDLDVSTNMSILE
jgi:hypothetical protein